MLLLASPTLFAAVARTEILDPAAAAALLGNHRFSLQWISWTAFGQAEVSSQNGLYRIRGTQTYAADTDPRQAP
jgi:hypothetical protein